MYDRERKQVKTKGNKMNVSTVKPIELKKELLKECSFHDHIEVLIEKYPNINGNQASDVLGAVYACKYYCEDKESATYKHIEEVEKFWLENFDNLNTIFQPEMREGCTVERTHLDYDSAVKYVSSQPYMYTHRIDSVYSWFSYNKETLVSYCEGDVVIYRVKDENSRLQSIISDFYSFAIDQQ